MHSRKVIHSDFKSKVKALDTIIQNFDSVGRQMGKGERNKIRTVALENTGLTLNVKSFKKPKLINKFAYHYIRKSKAERSYTYANRLLENNIGTPQPIAYYLFSDPVGLQDSYYISEHLNADLTYRELVTDPNYPDHESILRQFTHFTYRLHQSGIYFKDHSPGNTLIKREGQKYEFHLVDLNRMEFFDTLDFEQRMKNFSRLTPKKEMVAIMSDEYAKLTEWSYEEIFDRMWNLTDQFQQKYYRKIRWKKRLYFWRK